MPRLPWAALKKERLSKGERKVFKKAACADFKIFCKLCGLPDYDFETEKSGQRKIAELICLTDRGPDGKTRQHCQAPRGGGKSSLFERHAAWRIARSCANWPDEPYKDGMIRILYTSATAKLAEESGKIVMDILENSNVTKVFGSFRDPTLWSAERFNVRHRKGHHRQSTWAIGSPEKSTTGHHPCLIYVDDAETEQSTRKLEKMYKTRAWFDELCAQLDPEGETRVCGTRYEENDLYGHIESQGDLWHVIRLDIINSTYPHMPPEHIEGLRLLYKDRPLVFSCYYMNNPWASDLQSFMTDQFQQAHYDKRIESLGKYILLDLAGSKADRSCETAMWIVSMDHLSNAYCIDIVRGHFEPDESMEHLRALFEKWRAKWFVIENRVITKFALPMVRTKERESGVHMPYRIACAANYQGKELHIMSLQPRFAENRMWFCDTLPKDEIRFVAGEDGKKRAEGPLVNAFTRFPRAKLKDVPDALAYIDGLDMKGARLVPIPKGRLKKTWHPQGQTNSPWSFPAHARQMPAFKGRRL